MHKIPPDAGSLFLLFLFCAFLFFVCGFAVGRFSA